MKLTVNSTYFNEKAGIYVHNLKSDKIEKITDIGGIKVKTARVDTYRFVTETSIDEGTELDFSGINYEIVEKEFMNQENNKPFTINYITIS